VRMTWVYSDEEPVEAAVEDPSRRKTLYGTLTNQVSVSVPFEVRSFEGFDSAK
jgi:hypothetical protein